MTAYYSFHKGKFGGVVGTIYPFTRTLDGDRPIDIDWRTYAPAGYLRCDGSILDADEYVALAEIIGVGDECIYRKEGTILENRNENGSGGEIQLPDFGSKYLSASTSNTGLVFDATAIQESTGRVVERVGVGVDLVSNQGEEITVNYSGNFAIPTTDIPISGNFVLDAPFQSAAAQIRQEQILTHGHYANVARIESPNVNSREWDNGGAGGRVSPVVRPYNQFPVGISGSVQSTQHEHGISRTNPNTNITASLQSTEIDASNITTTVNVDVSDTTAFNDVTQRFILVEYLIKF